MKKALLLPGFLLLLAACGNGGGSTSEDPDNTKSMTREQATENLIGLWQVGDEWQYMITSDYIYVYYPENSVSGGCDDWSIATQKSGNYTSGTVQYPNPYRNDALTPFFNYSRLKKSSMQVTLNPDYGFLIEDEANEETFTAEHIFTPLTPRHAAIMLTRTNWITPVDYEDCDSLVVLIDGIHQPKIYSALHIRSDSESSRAGRWFLYQERVTTAIKPDTDDPNFGSIDFNETVTAFRNPTYNSIELSIYLDDNNQGWHTFTRRLTDLSFHTMVKY